MFDAGPPSSALDALNRRPSSAVDPAAAKSRVSMREVARLADVSVATVSMVLNSNPKISKATQVKVQRVMDKLGYRPNRLAQSLSSQHTRVIAVLLPPLRHAFSDPYFGELLSGICDRADRLGHKVMLEAAKPEFVREKRHVELYERRYIDGMLCLGFNDKHGFLRDFADRTYPMVSVNNSFGAFDLDYVKADYAGGAEQVMSMLLQLGHERVGLVAGAAEAASMREIIDTFRKRMAAAGLAVPDCCVQDGRFTEEGGAAAAERILDQCTGGGGVTAIFAGNDKMALGVMHTLAQRGLSVPKDVSVVGFDDLRHMAFVTPGLTTVHLPLYEVGLRSCERLIERIRGKAERVADTLPTHLVLRDSTAIVPRR